MNDLNHSFRLAFILTLALCLLPLEVNGGGGDARIKAEAAVNDILFQLEEVRLDQLTVKVKDGGYINLTVDVGVPDEVYGRLIDTFRAHPDIKGVLPVKGYVCSRPI